MILDPSEELAGKEEKAEVADGANKTEMKKKLEEPEVEMIKEKKVEEKSLDAIDTELFSLISSWKNKYGPVTIEKDRDEKAEKEKNKKKTENLISELRGQMSALSSGETVKEFLESSILSKKEINQLCEHINRGQRDFAKQFLDLTTMEFKDRNTAKKLIDEWPDNIWLTLDKIDPSNKKDTEEHNRWKKFDDGTFEMIPEFPEQEPRDIVTDMHRKIKLLNGGNNLIEFIKTLPVTRQNKVAML